MADEPSDTPPSDSKPAEGASSAAPAEAPRPSASVAPSARDRIVEWFTRRDALRAASARSEKLDPRAATRLDHASRSLESAHRLGLDEAALSPALALLREAAKSAFDAMTPADSPATDLETAWSRAPGDRLERIAGNTHELTAARRALIEHASLDRTPSDPSLREDVRIASSFVKRLVTDLDATGRLVPQLKRERAARLASGAVAGAAVLVGAWLAWHEYGPNYAETAQWRASSETEGLPITGVGFHPIEGHPNVFFHTRPENEPWIEFDFGETRTVSYLALNNRIECCQDRAIPLVFELSEDHAHWTEIARQTEKFYSWRRVFMPHRARYARFRVLRPTMLHLGWVRIN